MLKCLCFGFLLGSVTLIQGVFGCSSTHRQRVWLLRSRQAHSGIGESKFSTAFQVISGDFGNLFYLYSSVE